MWLFCPFLFFCIFFVLFVTEEVSFVMRVFYTHKDENIKYFQEKCVYHQF